MVFQKIFNFSEKPYSDPLRLPGFDIANFAAELGSDEDCLLAAVVLFPGIVW
jgi:hypothetical protein